MNHILTPYSVRMYFNGVCQTKCTASANLLRQVYSRLSTVFAVRGLRPNQPLDNLTAKMAAFICHKFFRASFSLFNNSLNSDASGRLGYFVMMLDAHLGSPLARRLIEATTTPISDFLAMFHEVRAARQKHVDCLPMVPIKLREE